MVFREKNYSIKLIILFLSIPAPILDLLKLSHGAYKSHELTGAKGSPGHEFIESRIIRKSKYAIGIEIPIVLYRGRNELTGHIDVLLADNNKIYVCDYKPDKVIDINDRLSQNFVNSMPQIAAYGLVLKQVFGLDVECVIFNSEGAWSFDPDKALEEITTFMHNKKDFLLWELFFNY